MTKTEIRTLDCKHCGEPVENVGKESVSVICWKCVNISMRLLPQEYKPESTNVQDNIRISG